MSTRTPGKGSSGGRGMGDAKVSNAPAGENRAPHDLSEPAHLPLVAHEDLHNMLRHGETGRVEFKIRVPAVRRFARLIASLANGGGGTILLGVDDTGRPVGLSNPSQTLATTHETATRDLLPPPTVKYRRGEGESGPILIVRIDAAEEPIRLAWEDLQDTYLRVNDHNQPVRSLPVMAHAPRSKRIARLHEKTRKRFLMIERSFDRVTADRYSRTCNVSARTARRDLHSLTETFLVVEVERGLYEIVRERPRKNP